MSVVLVALILSPVVAKWCDLWGKPRPECGRRRRRTRTLISAQLLASRSFLSAIEESNQATNSDGDIFFPLLLPVFGSLHNRLQEFPNWFRYLFSSDSLTQHFIHYLSYFSIAREQQWKEKGAIKRPASKATKWATKRKCHHYNRAINQMWKLPLAVLLFWSICIHIWRWLDYIH